MSMMGDNSIAVIASASEKVRSKDTLYPYKTEYKIQLSMASQSRGVRLWCLYQSARRGSFAFFAADKNPLRRRNMGRSS